MSFPQKIKSRLPALFHKRRLDEQMTDEMRSHIEMQTQENTESGMSPEEARYAALRQFGRIESIKETCRDQRGVSWIEHFSQDLKHGMRMLRKNPGFTIVAALTLALGIGSNTVAFSVVKAVLFRSLGFDAPDQLVWLRLADQGRGKIQQDFSWLDFTDLRADSKGFDHMALVAWPGVTWEHDDRVEGLAALSATPSLFNVLRLRPELGRPLIDADIEPSASPVILISHELWQNRFAGDPGILGKTLRLDEKLHTIVGVLPPRLEFPLGHAPSAETGVAVFPGVRDLWMPLRPNNGDRTARGNRMFLLIGRLRSGVALETVRAELAALGRHWASEFPDTNRGWNLELITFRDQVFGRTRQGIHILCVAVAAILLVCCVNLANLLLARGIARQRELAVRRALGAARSRLVRTLLTEGMLLSLLGGVLGFALAGVAVPLLRTFGPDEVPFIREIVMDRAVVGYTVVLCFVTTLMSSLLPALWQSKIGGVETLKSGSRSSAGLEIRSWQHSLLIGQIALVLVLLSSSVLLLESFRRLMGVDLGYQPNSVIAMDLDNWGLPTNADTVRLHREIQSRLAALPGVEAVGTIQSAPLTGKWAWEEKAQTFGNALPLAEQPSLAATIVAFDYFQAMGIPLVSGRFFRPSELSDDGYGKIAILNESAAVRLFPEGNAIGKQFAIASSPERFYEVVGVVKDTRDARLEQRPQPRFYLHYSYGGAQVIVRSKMPAKKMIPQLRAIVSEFGSRVIVNSIKPMTDIISETVAERRFLIVTLATYAGIALGIAIVGVFGVVTFQVNQRTSEFGIRLALGSSPSGLLRLVIAQASRIVIAGLLIGLLLSLGAGRFLASQMFGLSPHDPWLLGVASGLLLMASLFASLIPARRAARIDPMTALRSD